MPLCITDLLFNVIGFLILLIALSNFEDKMDSNEKVLQQLKLSEQKNLTGAKHSEAKIIINVFKEGGDTKIEIDGKGYTLETLQQYLKTFGATADVALRCAEDVLVGFHDNVLAACKRAGIENIEQIVKTGK